MFVSNGWWCTDQSAKSTTLIAICVRMSFSVDRRVGPRGLRYHTSAISFLLQNPTNAVEIVMYEGRFGKFKMSHSVTTQKIKNYGFWKIRNYVDPESPCLCPIYKNTIRVCTSRSRKDGVLASWLCGITQARYACYLRWRFAYRPTFRHCLSNVHFNLNIWRSKLSSEAKPRQFPLIKHLISRVY